MSTARRIERIPHGRRERHRRQAHTLTTFERLIFPVFIGRLFLQDHQYATGLLFVTCARFTLRRHIDADARIGGDDRRHDFKHRREGAAMTGLLLPLVLLGCGVAMSLATGFALHRLAPAAGYVSEVERRDFRNFGFEWGWLTPLPALLYWFTEVWKFHAPPTAAAPVEFGAQSAAELSTTLARRRRRLAAWAIDIGWILTAWSISLLLFRSIGWAIGAEDGTLLLLLGLWLASCVPISMAYATLFLARRGDHNGQTPGKRAVGVRVVRRDGQELTLANAARREIVGRHLPGLVTGVILYGVIDGGWCLFDERKQTLHDRIGATIVVSAR